MSVDLWRVFESFQIGTIFWSVSGNFQHVSGNFDCTKIIYLFSIMTQQISRLLKVSSVCPQVSVICSEIFSMSPYFFLNFFILDEDEYYYYFFFHYLPIKHSELLKVYSVCLNFFLLHTKTILFLYRMIQKMSGLLKNFRIAMLPCYRGFSLSAALVLWWSQIIFKAFFLPFPSQNQPIKSTNLCLYRQAEGRPSLPRTGLCHRRRPVSGCSEYKNLV